MSYPMVTRSILTVKNAGPLCTESSRVAGKQHEINSCTLSLKLNVFYGRRGSSFVPAKHENSINDFKNPP